jgi:hypothetical protein
MYSYVHVGSNLDLCTFIWPTPVQTLIFASFFKLLAVSLIIFITPQQQQQQHGYHSLQSIQEEVPPCSTPTLYRAYQEPLH